MDTSFFKSPYSAEEEGGQQYDAELAKAESGVMSHTTKISRKDEDAAEPEGQLTIDVYQTPENIVIESAVAGVDPENLDIHVSNDSVTIRGARRHEKEVRDEDYLYQECYWGRFSRSVILPQEVDAENAIASFARNGILRITLPKANKQKSKKLKVKLE